jgi:hypothetical protein
MIARHLSPFDLQRYAGWSSIEPARVYIHADMSQLERAIKQINRHPLTRNSLNTKQASAPKLLTCKNTWSGGQDLNLRPDIKNEPDQG